MWRIDRKTDKEYEYINVVRGDVFDDTTQLDSRRKWKAFGYELNKWMCVWTSICGNNEMVRIVLASTTGTHRRTINSFLRNSLDSLLLGDVLRSTGIFFYSVFGFSSRWHGQSSTALRVRILWKNFVDENIFCSVLFALITVNNKN